MPKENLLITENQGLDVHKKKESNILSLIEPCNNFQDFIKKLEKENLIWYFICPLHKDEKIKEQVSSKWKEEFHKFEQLINETHKKLEESLPGENFLVYTTKDNDFQIRFENKEKPIEISTLLRASDKGKIYNLPLGKDSQITATKKGSERHYNFTGPSSCKMTINWQAKDSKGNNINCSMTVKIDSSGIKNVVDEPKFGGITDLEEVLKLVEQNKEVFINGKILHQAFTNMVKNVNEQQTLAEEIFTKDSLQSATPSSSGYSSLSTSTPSSRRSSFFTESEIGDEESEITDEYIDDGYDQQKMYKDYERKYEQEGLKGADETINEINKLAEQRDFLRDEVNEQRQVISEKNQRIKEQGTLIESLMSKEQLKNQELVKELNQLYKEKEDLEIAIQQSSIGKKSFADEIEEVEKNKKIESLREEIKQKDEKIQQIVRESQKLEGKLQDLMAKYLEVKNEDSEYIENLTRKLKQAEIEFIDNKGKLTEQIEKLAEEKENLFRQLRAKSTDSTSFRKQQSEIDKLKQQLKEKEGMLMCTREELASVKESLEQLQNILQQKKDQAAISTQTEVEYESKGIEASDHETTVPKTQDQGTQAADKTSSKRISELRQENKKLARDKLTISEQLKQKIKEIGELKKNSKQLQEENTQLKQKATKGTGVDASSLTDQKEIKEMEVQTDVQMNDFHDLYDKEGKYVRTELSDPKSTPAKVPEKSTPSKG